MSAALAVMPEEPETKRTDAQLHEDVMLGVAEGKITILDLFDDLPWLRGETAADWTAWRAFLAALYGLPMTPTELGIFRACTGRQKAPTAQASEAWVAVGRRGRKSAIAAVIGLWEAAFRFDCGKVIAPGEVATYPILSVDKDKAGQIHAYVKAIVSDPMFSYLLAGKPTTETIPLLIPAPSGSYRVDFVIRAANIRSGRSRTALGFSLDEVAFFRSEESANPDAEIIAALQPSMVSIPGAMSLGLSSPYARRGVLWDKYREFCPLSVPADQRAAFPIDSRVLFWKADTLAMHDSPQIRFFVAEQYEKDHSHASAEFGAEFRADVEAYVTHEVVDAATSKGVLSRQPVEGVHYVAFVDPSGGTGDPFAGAVAHWDGSKAVLDLLFERIPPFRPDAVTEELAAVLKPYGIKRVRGDHWAGEWPPTIFRQSGLTYDAEELPKSDIYRDFLPALNSGDVDLLDHKKLKQQLVSLDRKSGRSGKDSIDHPPGGHDDVCNAACGALLMAAAGHRKPKEIRVENQEQFEKRRIHEGIRERLKKMERAQGRHGGGGMPSF